MKFDLLLTLVVAILDLLPMPRHARAFHVWAFGVLSHDALHAKSQGTSKHRKTFPFHVLDVKQPRIPFQEFLKKLLPAAKRVAAQPHVAKLQQIEDVIDQGSLLWAAIHEPFKAGVATLVQKCGAQHFSMNLATRVLNGSSTEDHRKKGTIVYYVFDLLRLGDKDLRPQPLYRRKSLLQKLLRKNDTLRYVDHITTEGLHMFAGALTFGLEGIVAKDPTSPYVEGPTQTWHWQKIKNKDYARKEKIEFKPRR